MTLSCDSLEYKQFQTCKYPPINLQSYLNTTFCLTRRIIKLQGRRSTVSNIDSSYKICGLWVLRQLVVSVAGISRLRFLVITLKGEVDGLPWVLLPTALIILSLRLCLNVCLLGVWICLGCDDSIRCVSLSVS